MSNPDIPMNLPTPSSASTSKGYQPPEIVANVQGSSAGAGSGEFHVYKASRRREYERLRGMEEEAKREDEDAKWEREKREKEEKEERERERKRRARERKKNRKGMSKGEGGPTASTVNNKESNGTAPEGNEKGPRGRLQIPGRKGEGDAEEVMENGDLGKENGRKATGEAQEEIGVVIHDED
jgi:Protein of unknown function (DUF1168)